jgi:23S rRNA (uracil1939-C5)-methyltransferase
VLARLPDGRVAFLRGAAPGDVVEAVVVEDRPRFVRAQVVRRVQAGPESVAPFCAVFDRCGGCPWQTVPAGAQRAALEAHVHRVLGRAAVRQAGEPPRLLPIVHTPPDRGWRSTVRLHWADGRLGFRAAGSHELVDIDGCPVVTPEVQALLDDVRAGLLPGLKGEGTLRLTAAPGAASGTVALEPAATGLATGVEAFVTASDRCHGAVLLEPGRRARAFGDPVNRFGAARVPHPAASFVQAHQPGNARLVGAVLAAVGPGPVLELFAGSGNFTLPLAAAGVRVSAVEGDAAAAARLRDEARFRNLSEGLSVECADAARPPRGAWPTLLLDPPRAGFRGVPWVADRIGAHRIVYVSCDPATLARDVEALVAAGWRLEEAVPFDLFPHTGHVEVLAVLGRGGDDPGSPSVRTERDQVRGHAPRRGGRR